MTTCRSCGAPIRWAKTPGGRPIPLNAEPDEERGNIELEIGHEVDTAIVVRGADLEPRPPGLYLSHFATCPQSSTHRRAR